MKRRFLVLVLPLAAAACRAKAPRARPSAEGRRDARDPARRADLREWIGTTEGDVNADIRPQVEGYLLRRVYTEGSFVQQGDLLFEIDPRQFEAQLQQAEANLEQAKAALAKADLDVARDEPLATQHAVSQQELDNARSAQQGRGRRSARSRRRSSRRGSTSRGRRSRRRSTASRESRRSRSATWSTGRPS